MTGPFSCSEGKAGRRGKSYRRGVPMDTCKKNGRRPVHPLDRLVEEAIKEYTEGKTTSIEDLAAELGINLNEDE